MERTDSLLDSIVKRLGLGDGVRLARIKNNWQRIFDKPLSLHMSPSGLSEGKLILNVDSPIWIQQLSYHKREITKKLAPYGVRDIQFKLGRISRTKRRSAPVRRHAEITSEDELFIVELTSRFSNEELKEAVKAAVERHLRLSRYPR
ncbi:MAG: DUF721 domain-containing protein [Nitrospirota bacterium]|nr:DUF721 domain-containing protein [Nitrospirota bacterium]